MSGSPRRHRVRREEDISGQFRVTVLDAEDLDQLRTQGGVYRRGLYPLGNRGNAPPEGTQSLPASSRESLHRTYGIQMMLGRLLQKYIEELGNRLA